MYNKHSKPINLKWIIISVAAGLAIALAATLILFAFLKKNPIPTDVSSSVVSQSADASSITSSAEELDEPHANNIEQQHRKIKITNNLYSFFI